MLKVNWNPNVKEVRRFAGIWMSAALVLSGILFYKHHATAALSLAGIGVSVAGFSWLAPSAARLFYRAWMGLSAVISITISYITMTVLYLGIMTPLAILFRIMGRDVLRIRRVPAKSYWQDHEQNKDSTSYRHLY